MKLNIFGKFLLFVFDCDDGTVSLEVDVVMRVCDNYWISLVCTR